MKFHQKQLDNGLQIVAELNPNVHSVAVGFFVRTGARDETPEVNGVSHFLEHMAFKGTEKYSAEDVNRIFDELGAKYNASTSEEVTLFYGAILPEYLPQVFELLAGILFPTLRQDDFDMEKKVILEEIAMYQDQPFHVAYEKSMLTHFDGHPLGTSILGTLESVGALTSDQMRKYHADHYRGGNITLVVAGNCEWEQIEALADQFCSHWPAGSLDRPTDEAQTSPNIEVIERDNSIQQTILELHPAPPAQSQMRFGAQILSVIVGDDGGSRIYWDLVDPGLVESADLGYCDWDGSGAYLTYLSCDPETTQKNLARIHAIYDEVNADGVTEVELEQAKNKIASRIVLRSERPMGRLSSLGTNWVYRQEYQSVADDLATLQSISLSDIRETLEAYPLGGCTTVCVGPLKEFAKLS
jgi:predicted Zn-dependent peptidase